MSSLPQCHNINLLRSVIFINEFTSWTINDENRCPHPVLPSTNYNKSEYYVSRFICQLDSFKQAKAQG
jgi:hypothetical protein